MESEVRALIEKAISIKGSEAKLGEACGTTQATIWRSKQRGAVSAELAKAIHDATGGGVACWELRPDLWSDPAPATESEGAAA